MGESPWQSTFTAEGLSLVSGEGNKIPRATQPKKENKTQNLEIPEILILKLYPLFNYILTTTPEKSLESFPYTSLVEL